MKKKKRLLCVLVAAVLLLGVLAGCGGGAEDGGSSSGSESGKPGVGATTPGAVGHKDDDPVAVMSERVQAVNDAVGFEFLELEETLKGGLFFYGLTQPSSSSGGTYDYNPNRPIDCGILCLAGKVHMDGIVTEDTYDLLSKFVLKSSELAEAGDEAVELVFSLADMVETDDLYVFYACCDPGAIPGDLDRWSFCWILVKDTDIAYFFIAGESYSPAINDAEYMFTSEFWKAFAQTAKFLGKVDDDTQYVDLIHEGFSSWDYRD